MKLRKQWILSSVIVLAGLVLCLAYLPKTGRVDAQGSGVSVKLPSASIYRNWYYLGSKSIRPEGATAIGLPAEIFGNTFDAVYANDVAIQNLRNGTLPYSDGAMFVATFSTLASPVDGLDTHGNLAFTAVMVKDSAAWADTGGWGFEAFAPDGTALTDLRQACVDCHIANAAGSDLVFSKLPAGRPAEVYPASDNGVFLPPNYRTGYYHVGTKFIRPAAATALALPNAIFDNTVSSVYANRIAWALVVDGARPFPPGTMFVADFHTLAEPVPGLAVEGDLAFTAVMIKKAAGQGDDPSTGDWAFEAFAPDGSPLSDLRSACIGCHASQASNDYVFTK
jgi:mono/diheme cytochrome c family protein